MQKVNTGISSALIRFIAAGLVCFAHVSAQEDATRVFSMDGALLNIPVSNGAPKQKLWLEVAGKQVREVEIEAATKEPDFWVFVDVSPWRGKEATLHGPAPLLAAIECGDEIKTREPVYSEKLRPQFPSSASPRK